jgi:hypothetical protein
MMLGMSLATFTLVHVLISLAGIASGFGVIFSWISGKRLEKTTIFFLATTVLTSVTGYMFPFEKLLPSHIVGGLSLVVLALGIYSLQSGWQRTFVISSLTAQYFNVFVLVVQLFRNTPALKQLAPTQSEPPFAIAQLIVLAAFVFLGVKATKGFPRMAVRAAH